MLSVTPAALNLAADIGVAFVEQLALVQAGFDGRLLDGGLVGRRQRVPELLRRHQRHRGVDVVGDRDVLLHFLHLVGVHVQQWVPCPSSALISRAGKTSAKAIGTALAPIVFQVSSATGLAITRIFRPFDVLELSTLRWRLDRLRKPMPVQREADQAGSAHLLEDLLQRGAVSRA